MIRGVLAVWFGSFVFGQADGVLEWIILLAAAATALGVLHVKVMKPAVLFVMRLGRGVDILLDMPRWHDTVSHRLDALERHLVDGTARSELWAPETRERRTGHR